MQGTGPPPATTAQPGLAAQVPQGTDSAAPTTSAAAATITDPLAPARARFKEIAGTLAQLAGILDPQVCATRAKLEDEKAQLGLQLHGALPLHVQLRIATTQLQKGLAALALMQDELQQLDLVMEDRRRLLEERRLATLEFRHQVDQLSLALKVEEAARIASVAAQCQLAAGPALAAPLGAVPPQLSLQDYAAGFLAMSPPGVATNFQRFLDAQVPLTSAAGRAAMSATAPRAAPTIITQLLTRRQEAASAAAAAALATVPPAAAISQ